MYSRKTAEKFSQFCRKLTDSARLPQYIFFVGESAEDLGSLLGIIRDRLVREYGSCDEVHLSGLDNEAASWHAELMTMPMFPSGRLILVRHAEALLKRIETQAKVLANYLNDFPLVPQFTVTVLQFREKKISRKLEALEELAQIYEDVPLGPDDITDELEERARSLGYKVSRETLNLLVDRSAGIQKTAYANFDRLLTYRMNEKEIRDEDVEETTEQSESNLHFRLIDATARRNIAECLQLLELHVLDEAESFVAALIRLFSESLRYFYYRENGVDLAEIGKTISSRPLTGYPLKKSAERWSILVQKYSPAGIRLVMDALIRADQLCKEVKDTAQQQVVMTSFYLMLSKAS